MTRMFSSLAIAAAMSIGAAAAALASTADSLAATTVKLNAAGGSRQSGTATLRQLGPQVVISGSVENASPYQLEPADLVKGSCGSAGPSVMSLGSVAGSSIGTRLLPHMTIAQLHAMHASIRVHKSEKAMGTIVSCGNI